jgi:hypothetical protein
LLGSPRRSASLPKSLLVAADEVELTSLLTRLEPSEMSAFAPLGAQANFKCGQLAQ